MSVQAYIQQATDVRRRLRDPVNAVPDRPLQMRNGWPVNYTRPPPPEPIATRMSADEFHRRCLEFFNACINARSSEPPKITSHMQVRRTLSAVSEAYGVSVNDMLSVRRTANVVRPRQVAMWLIKNLTLNSLPWIGRRFGGRDHTTVLHATRKIDRLRDSDPELCSLLDQFMSALRIPQSENSNADISSCLSS